MHRNLSALRITSGKKLDRLSAAILTRLLGVPLKINECLSFCLARVRSDFCTDGGALVQNGHKQTEQSQHHAIQSQAHASVVPLRALSLSSRPELYTLSLLYRTTLVAAIINAELLSAQ